MNKFYIMALGSMDCVFFGPFDTAAIAGAWAETAKAKKPRFDYYPFTEVEMKENIAEFGECPIQQPEAA